MNNRYISKQMFVITCLAGLNFLSLLISTMVYDSAVWLKIVLPFLVGLMSFGFNLVILKIMNYFYKRNPSQFNSKKTIKYIIIFDLLILLVLTLTCLKIIADINYSLIKFNYALIIQITLALIIDTIIIYFSFKKLSLSFEEFMTKFNSCSLMKYLSFLAMIATVALVCSSIWILFKYNLSDYVIAENLLIFNGYVWHNLLVMSAMIILGIYQMLCFSIACFLKTSKQLFILGVVSLNPVILLAASIKRYRENKTP
ncbi:hypothetical protein [Mesoplasma seiffertii]|uniref:hypothetical protein n=1 Tax=Mesoplasma seiffertii TaxID=28224 RepID=UPI00047BB107|nr:hypothetical protein [Mesoplasma seiffertii]